MEINIIKLNPKSIYKFDIYTGLPENKLAENFVKELDEKVGNKNYIIILEESNSDTNLKNISFESIISNQ